MKTNDAQMTVLVLLIILLAMEVVRSSTVKGTTTLSFSQLAKDVTGNSWKKVSLWFIGALALILLAGVAGTFTIWVVVLIMVGVLISNAQVYTSWLTNATKTLGG
jgi:hypothetical protein